MCGFAGFVDFERTSLNEMRKRLSLMTDALAHRGPDGQGQWIEDNVGLGHRRLSVLDVSEAGAQPMVSRCERFVIAFNGEIYNHLELRREIEEANGEQNWNGHSDTETLLAGIRYWGLDGTLCRAAGMFAIAVWDRQLKRLKLARDRVGEKPLYWGWAGRTLVFGSELKALRLHPGVSKEICRSALVQYLHFGYVPAPRSIHSDLFKVEPGCIVEIGEQWPASAPASPLRPAEVLDGISIRRWWSLTELVVSGASEPFVDDRVAVNELEMALTSAVRRQMLSDVPLGAFLSGGVDSTTIVGLMQRESERPVKTYTVGFDLPDFDESVHAASVARHLGTDHTGVRVTESEAREVIWDLPSIYDEPFGDPSQIPTHLVCRAARVEVTVALSGDAGDELFGGYNRYFWGPRIWSRISLLPVSLRTVLGATIGAVPATVWDWVGKTGPERLRVSQAGEKAHRLAHRLRTVESLDDLYLSLVTEWDGEELVRGGHRLSSALLDDEIPAVLAGDPAGKMMLKDIRTYLPDDILCKVDRAAMAVGLESRVPFLDPDVLMLSARLPPRMKIRDGVGKWALREVLYRLVPRDLVERPKTGFGVPVGIWIRGPLRSWAEELLSVSALSEGNLLDPEPIRRAWAEHLSGHRDWTNRLWRVLMFQAWRRQL